MTRPEVVIRFTFGDALHLGQLVWWSLRHRSVSALRRGWWSWRETHRRGQWRPWTVGDHIFLMQRRAAVRTWPHGPRPARWRHYARGGR